MSRSSWTYVGHGAIVLVLAAGWLVGHLAPHTLAGAMAWTAAVFGVLFGLGGGVRRLAGVSLDLGEQLILGTIVWIAGCGVLIALGIASRVPLLVLAALASLLAVLELRDRARRAAAVDSTAPAADRDPSYTWLGIIVGGLLLFIVLGSIGSRGNPYDDHAAYSGFVKRLLDCGDLVEPFSFRRLSAYGGQTALLALTALRGDVETSDLTDRGIFQVIAVLVVLQLARRRQVHVGVAAVLAALMLLAWDMSFNSACMWSGIAMFAAAYNFVSRDDVPTSHSVALGVACCAAACTLRQNYIAPAAVLALLAMLSPLRMRARELSWRQAWIEHRRPIALCIGIAAAIVIPYAISTWISNRTFLYPLLRGTANPALPLQPTSGTALDELGYFFGAILYPDPYRIWWVMIPFMVVARDLRPRRPWRMFLIASAAGWFLLVHSFTLADVTTLWRYAIGFTTPLLLIFLIEIADHAPFVSERAPARLKLPAVGVFLVWTAAIVHLISARGAPLVQLHFGIANIKAAYAMGTEKAGAKAQHYRDMQASLPEGAGVAILLDDTYLLDYDRNRIFNIDLPGFAAPAPQIPSFLGPERYRAYFTSLGIRYLAYVDPTRSSYLYRRATWIYRVFSDDNDMWRFLASHTVDILDTFGELARTRPVIFDREGLRVIDLGEEPAAVPTATDEPERVRMDRHARHLSETELGNNAWQLASRSDVVFQADGYSPTAVQLEDKTELGLVAKMIAKLTEPKQDPPCRFLMERTHVRVHGRGRHRLRVTMWVDTVRLYTQPTVSLSIDGSLLSEVVADASGNISFDSEVSCEGWCSVYIKLSTISEFWVAPDHLRAVKLLGFDWTEPGS